MRTERDSLGEMELADDCLYGIHTARALANFPLGHRPANRRLIHAIVKVKKAAHLTYAGIDPERGAVHREIAAACDEVLGGGFDHLFMVEALQGGAGTSTHMNVNEVLANLTLRRLGKAPGDYSQVHPLDDVNRGQSTNDVYPTALRLAAIESLRELSQAAADLQQAFQARENSYRDIGKLGRTELMDAVPISLGDEFASYAQALARDRWRLYKMEERLRQVNIGGTAVGKTAPADRRYRFGVIERLREITGIGFAMAEYPMDLTQNSDVFVEASGLLKALAVNLMKIAGDLRLMNSGPQGGLGEIRLAPLQAGSSIMPGKYNPVIPEMLIQVALRVMANDSAIGFAAGRGEFELNAFTPLIADALLESLGLLTPAVRLFQGKCVELLVPDRERCLAHLDASLAFAAAYVESLGYDRVSSLIAASPGDPARVRAALDQALTEPD